MGAGGVDDGSESNLEHAKITGKAAPDRAVADSTNMVLHVAGVARSGSSLVERLIVERIGGTALGEIAYLIERGLVGEEPCACGETARTCPVWSDVIRSIEIFGMVEELKLRERRARSLKWYLGSGRTVGFRDSDPYTLFIRDLLAALEKHDLVIETSKGYPHLGQLAALLGKRLRILHLVRDPRGTAYSWRKRLHRPEGAEALGPMSPQWVALNWLSHNALIAMRGPSLAPYVRVRYEDVCRDPTVLVDALERLGIGPGVEALTKSYHSIAGNPMRFTQRELKVRPDFAWHTQLSDFDRKIVWTLTGALASRFGYRKDEAAYNRS